MADLITSARALYNLNNMTPTASETTTIAALVTAASKLIERFCNRDFTATNFTEWLHGNGTPVLYVKNPPINSVKNIRHTFNTVLKVKYTGSAEQASVRTLSTTLTLRTMSSGTATETALTYGAAPTLSQLVTAIVAVSGWTAEVASSAYTNWPSDEIVPNYGPMNAKNLWALLVSPTEFLESFRFDSGTGALWISPFEKSLYPNTIWPMGQNNIYCQYNGGFSTIPEPIQEACAVMVAQWFYQTKRDPSLTMEKTVGHTFTAHPMFNQPFPENVRRLLIPYRVWKM